MFSYSLENRGLLYNHQLAERRELFVWKALEAEGWLVAEECDSSEARRFFSLSNQELEKIMYGAVVLKQGTSTPEKRKVLLSSVLGEKKYQTLEACMPEACDLLEKALAVYAPHGHISMQMMLISSGYQPNGEVRVAILEELARHPENSTAIVLAAQMYAHTELRLHHKDEMGDTPFVFDVDGLPQNQEELNTATAALEDPTPEIAAHMHRVYLAAGGSDSGFVEKITPLEAEQSEKMAVELAQKTCIAIQDFLLQLEGEDVTSKALYRHLNERFITLGCAVNMCAEDFARLVIAERYGYETKFDFMDDVPGYLEKNLAGKIAHHVLNTMLCARMALRESGFEMSKDLQSRLGEVDRGIQKALRRLSEFFISGRLPKEIPNR